MKLIDLLCETHRLTKTTVVLRAICGDRSTSVSFNTVVLFDVTSIGCSELEELSSICPLVTVTSQYCGEPLDFATRSRVSLAWSCRPLLTCQRGDSGMSLEKLNYFQFRNGEYHDK